MTNLDARPEPPAELTERNQALELAVAERTTQLSAANEHLQRANAELARETGERRQAEDALQQSGERYRSTLKFQGRGLGLAVALRVVRAHHGAITVESEPDHGSVFHVFFPVIAGN